MKYELSKGLWKGIIAFICFIIPFLASQFIIQFPDIANLTIGAVLIMIVNYIKISLAK